MKQRKVHWILSLQDFVSAAQWSFSSFGKTFSFSLSRFFSVFNLCTFHVLTFLSLPPFLCSLRPSLYQSFSSSIYLPLVLSVPISALLSMASTRCFPPPVLISLYSPRMHLFKACFTKTVLKRKERELGIMLGYRLRCRYVTMFTF